MSSSRFHRFGPFVIIRLLGRGAMGEVHLARTEWSESKLVALKMLKEELHTQKEYAERFARELSLAIRLEHTNVVASMAQGEVEGRPYLASQYIEGQDLGNIITRVRQNRSELPLPVIVGILKDLLSGLAYIHELKSVDGQWLELIHQDIAPGNILIGYDGCARITDFGIATSAVLRNSPAAEPDWAQGRAEYRAPEIDEGQKPNASSDIYSLGVIVRQLIGDAPAWLDRLIETMLSSSPMKRSSAKTLSLELETASKKAQVHSSAVSCSRWLEGLFPNKQQFAITKKKRILTINPSRIQKQIQYTLTFTKTL